MSILDDNILEETNIYEMGFPKKDNCIFLNTQFSAYCFINDNFSYAARSVLNEILPKEIENYKTICLYEWKNPELFKNTMFANGIYILYKTGSNELYMILKGFQYRDEFLCDLNKSHWHCACYDDRIKEDIFSLYQKDDLITITSDPQQLMMNYLLEIKNNFNCFYNKFKCPFKTTDDYHTIDLQIHFAVNDFFNTIKYEHIR